MGQLISVITASLPTRTGMLAEAIASVAAQTLPTHEHLIGVDLARVGPSEVRNSLLAAANSEWIAVLDDDDLMLPNHLERLASQDADIIYSYCRVEGRGWNPNHLFDPNLLRTSSYMPITALYRASLLRDLGGWRERDDCEKGLEDWDLYRRALEAGASFVCLPEETWVYRFHGGNRTFRPESPE